MPLKQHIDREAGLLTVVVEGELVFEELRSFVKAIYEDDFFPPLPGRELSYTLISSIKESARPDKVREKIFQHLQWLFMNAMGVHKSGKFHLADLAARTGDEDLIQPAYGVLTGTRFFMFSSAVEGAEAVYKTAEAPGSGLLSSDDLTTMVTRLGGTASAAFVFHIPTVKKHLFDGIRQAAYDAIDPKADSKAQRGRIEAGWKKEKKQYTEDDLDVAVNEWEESLVRDRYPFERSRYLDSLAALDPGQYLVGYVSLGVGAEKKVRAGAAILLSDDVE